MISSRSVKGLKMEVYFKLKEDITNGTLKDHVSITQKKALELYGVSGTPFREAVQILEAEGWVYSLPNKGVYVSPLTIKEIEEIFEIRNIIECAIAKKVSQSFDDNKRSELQDLIDLMNPDSSVQTDLEFTNLDYLFHKTLNEYSDNKRLFVMTEQLYDMMKRIGNIVLKKPSRREEVIREHKDILQGIIDGNPESAIKNHFNNVEKTIKLNY
ncbi:GntR family transcriptional regulator [Sporosarcina sp. SAFN-015]|uniref:GntR family transcriptional regulator n=1 Tax=Sporosarcina sp. SAFN-015 TaxID=3387274 RepID=UPI003F804EB5